MVGTYCQDADSRSAERSDIWRVDPVPTQTREVEARSHSRDQWRRGRDQCGAKTFVIRRTRVGFNHRQINASFPPTRHRQRAKQNGINEKRGVYLTSIGPGAVTEIPKIEVLVRADGEGCELTTAEIYQRRLRQ